MGHRETRMRFRRVEVARLHPRPADPQNPKLAGIGGDRHPPMRTGPGARRTMHRPLRRAGRRQPRHRQFRQAHPSTETRQQVCSYSPPTNSRQGPRHEACVGQQGSMMLTKTRDGVTWASVHVALPNPCLNLGPRPPQRCPACGPLLHTGEPRISVRGCRTGRSGP